MLFNSIEYLIFLPLVLLIYFIVPQKAKNTWLLIASYFFYMCWNAKYIVLILASTIVTYTGARLIDRFYGKKKSILIAVVTFNVLMLFFFKYLNFSVSVLGTILSVMGIKIVVPNFDIVLPVGISFYCFQAMGYTIDVYRGEVAAEKNFIQYALFVSFFPQLVAGPIERSKNLMGQLAKVHEFDYERVVNGILVILWGYFLKIVIADRIAVFVDFVYGDFQSYPGMYLIIATVFFAFQIYCDFYGYSTIAIGSAMILGIELMDNFKSPYLADSVANFWRGWHISLTTWFKDYVYIPLGGNRKGKARSYFNKMFVFLLSGLWHGASFTYVIWGGINGLYQIVGSVIKPIKRRIVEILRIDSDAIFVKTLKAITTFVLVDISWIFFRAKSVGDAIAIIKSIVNTNNFGILLDGSLYECGLDQKNFIVAIICLIVLLFSDIIKKKNVVISKILLNQTSVFRCAFIAVAIGLIMLFGKWGPSFEQANFIYFQF